MVRTVAVNNHWSGYTRANNEGDICARSVGRILMTIGISQSAAKYLLDDGFKDWEDVARLEPEDVDKMLRHTRKPGGGFEGHCVPTMSAKRLKVVVYIFRYFVRTQYFLNLDRIGLETIR